jgi:nitrogenase subunit NifH
VLGVLGGLSAYVTAQAIRSIYGIEVNVIGYLPVMVNGDKNEKIVTMKTISSIARDCGLSVLPAIKYDESVLLAARNRKFVADFFAGSSAAESYSGLAKMLMDSVAARI